ncbi:MAG: BadF/BadG/BcrA/BcrD ATPase family protein [Ignavibacteria bacterium]
MQYLIGIDGGATKTACIATDMDRNILFECFGGPSNFLITGADKVSEMLFSLITRCRDKLQCSYSDFASIVLGTTGAGRRTDAEELELSFKACTAAHSVSLPFHVESDAMVALEGAFSGKAGSILISGTGSVMFGKDASGSIHRVGGFGRFIGDEGSGYVIGRNGLSLLSKEYDGRGSKTMLSELVSAKFNISDPDRLITAIYKNQFDIASVAPLVIEVAEKGDRLCKSVLIQECSELIEHIRAMIKKINEPTLNLSLTGSIITSDNYFSGIFKERIAESLPNVKIQKPDYPPAMGAIIMALQRL